MSIFSGINNPGVDFEQLTSSEVALVQQISLLGDPNADRILFWDDSAGSYAYLTVGSGLSITDTTITATGGGGGIGGATGATDNAILRADGISSDILQTSLVTIDDFGNVDGVADLAVGNDIEVLNDILLATGSIINWNAGDVAITHSANQLAFTGATSGYSFDATVSASALSSTSATITLSAATLTRSGAHTLTLTTSGATNVTLPTTGTLSTLAGLETLTNKTLNLTSNTLSGTTAQFNTALSDGDFATLAGSETLTNKTINLTSNTLSGTTAQFNTALSDGDFATLAGSETLTNKTLTAPKFADLGFIADSNGNELVIFDLVASAVNEITVGNAATGNNPFVQSTGGDTNIGLDISSKGTGSVTIWSGAKARELLILPDVTSSVNEVTIRGGATGTGVAIEATGGDTNIDLRLTPKGSGKVVPQKSVNFGAFTAYFTETDNGNSGTTDTIDWTVSNKQKSTLTGNCTFTFTAPPGPCSLILKLVQDGTGSRTVTWPAAVHWSGGTAPTLTTTASKVDIISFYYDGTTYFGAANLNFTA